jgi:hypothetical protein
MMILAKSFAETPSGLAAWPEASWQACQQLRRKIQRAKSQGWTLAARRLARELHDQLGNLSGALADARGRLRDQLGDPSPGCAPSELAREILALFDEYSRVTWDPRAQTLAVETEELELEHVPLGAFAIRLELAGLPDEARYEIVALAPHPAASNSDVTHPHVSDGTLCEGTGHRALARALAELRLSDFFRIVAQILRTYNPVSPYVALEQWSGRSCDKCGDTVHPDDCSRCENCESELCSDCASSCEVCGQTHCSSCLDACPECARSACADCWSPCVKCRTEYCSHCLEGENCAQCQEHTTEDTADTEAEPAASAAESEAAPLTV